MAHSDSDAPLVGGVRSLTLVHKVGLVLALLVLALLAVGITSQRALVATEDAMTRLIGATVPASVATYEMEINVVEVGLKVLKYLEVPDPQYRTDALKDMADFDRFHRQYADLANTPDELALVQRAGAAFNEFRALGLRLMDDADTRREHLTRMTRDLQQLDDLIDESLIPQIDLGSPWARAKLNAARGLEVNAAEVAAGLGFHGWQATPAHRALIFENATDFERDLKSMRRLPLNAKERTLVAEIVARWRVLHPGLNRSTVLKEAADSNLDAFLRMRQGLDDLLDDSIQQRSELQLAGTLSAVHAAQQHARSIQLGGFALSLLGAIAAYGWIARSMQRSMQRLKSGVETLAGGSLDTRLAASGDHDVDQVLASFNRMALQLEQTMVSKTQLERSEQRFDHAVRGSQAGIWDWDLTTDSYYASPRYKELLGYSDTELPNDRQRLLSHLHPDDSARVDAAYRAHFMQHAAYDVQYRLRHRDGSYRWCRDVGQAVRDGTGKVLRFSGSVSDIDAQKRAEARIERMAHYDALTDIPGRTLFRVRLQQAIIDASRHQRLVAVLFLDLDRFKSVNDSLGHSGGDALLQEVARRLQDCVRRGDTVARFSGDEFGAVLADIGHLHDVSGVAHKFMQAFVKPFQLHDQECFVTASIGIALYPVNGSNEDELLHNADTAMYRSKAQGGNAFQFYSSDMTTDASHRIALESAMRHALERDEFILHYQPVVTPRGYIVGVEALIRWQHPQLGLLPPSAFIGAAEETGLILPIGEWVLQTACAQMQRWHTEGFAELTLAVNISTRQLRQHDLAQIVARSLHSSGLAAPSLELEITESVLAQGDESAIMVRTISATGVRFAIDDFGTGYSSLAYLKRFAIATLKIDQSFVRNIPVNAEDTAIALAIIALARSLGLRVIAEGVENEAQLDFLRLQGCDALQGYLFSLPLPAEQLTALLQDNGPPSEFMHWPRVVAHD